MGTFSFKIDIDPLKKNSQILDSQIKIHNLYSHIRL